jgi:hypothetical protein
MQETTSALRRYAERNGMYPAKLSDLYPDFLETRDILHCPADHSSPDSVSYKYTRPKMSDPPDKAVLSCARHTIIGVNVVVQFCKDGGWRITDH